MSNPTQIQPDKIGAYMATRYRIDGRGEDIVLVIGQRSERLADLFIARGVECGAFITACNPRGSLQSDAANDRAHAELAARLAQHGLEALDSSGSAEASDWPTERGYFVLGLGLDEARTIGARFDQDAIVWAGVDAIPQLILLR